MPHKTHSQGAPRNQCLHLSDIQSLPFALKSVGVGIIKTTTTTTKHPTWYPEFFIVVF